MNYKVNINKAGYKGLLLLPLLWIMSVSCIRGEVKNNNLNPNEDTTSYHSHTYNYKVTGVQELKLDVFTPEINFKKGKLIPAIIFFHGGGWVSGNRTYFHWQCRYFAKHGIIAITADYRLMKKGADGIYGTKEICIRDAKSAIRWVKEHAEELHINPDKIIVGGGSAGGHLATMAVLDTTINDPTDDTAISTSARALVLFNPGYPMHDDASLEPFRLVSSKVPPTIMFFGSKDKWKRPADKFCSMLRQEGASCEMWIANDQTHAFFNKKPWNLITCIKAHEFLVKYNLMKSNIPKMPGGVSLIKEDQTSSNN